MAPEIFEGGGHHSDYSPACDMWGVGVIAHLLTAGYLPFGGVDEEGLRD